MNRPLNATLLAAILGVVSLEAVSQVLVESEAFDQLGGWVLDQQFMDQMGSPFLLAHGLGDPVADAVTTVTLPAAGTYRVWVRTRDWVATWNAPGAPGRFQVLIDGRPIDTTFGTTGAEWHWQDGGAVEIHDTTATVALHDLTGFEGRCDAICFTADNAPAPPNAGGEMAAWRRTLLGYQPEPEDAGSFDLIVVGGGTAGTCAAIAAARLDLSVAFIQDRPVLGGNNSSEVRVWLQGATNGPLYPRIGDVVNELRQAKKAHYGPANTAEIYEDDKKIALARAEENIALYLGHRANAVEMDGEKIGAVIAQDIATARRLRFRGKWVLDSTGDGCVGFLAGADYELTAEGHMGRCNLWHVREMPEPVTFPSCPWALDLSDKPFPGRGGKGGIKQLGGWYWESGFDHDPFAKSEYIRDWNFRAMYGAWDCLKNVDRIYPKHKLTWAAYISGKRESRRLMGDVVLNKQHLMDAVEFPDRCVVTGWKIDLHLPHPAYVKGFEGDAFISHAKFTSYPTPFHVPYRCFYSRNVPNLFMAGRCISVTHDALGTTRVMKTGGLMGEVVGMAAAVCKRHDAMPRDVYNTYWHELDGLMKAGIGRAPPGPNRSDMATPEPPRWLKDTGKNLARSAKAAASGEHSSGTYPASRVNDGNADTTSNASRWISDTNVPNWVELTWEEPQTLNAARVVTGFRDGNGNLVGCIGDFALQHLDPSGDWKDIAGTKVTGNTSFDWGTTFDPVRSLAVRLLVTATHADASRVWEIEFYNLPGTPPSRKEP